jgi:hypothetical protein
VDAALPQSGTLAARASVTHHVGLFYYATDTAQMFVSDGVAWKDVPVGLQAWQTLTGGASGLPNLAYYKDSLGLVHIRADAVAPTSFIAQAASTSLGWTFPPSYRPGTTVNAGLTFMGQGGSTAPYTKPITIGTDGVVRLVGNNSWLQTESMGLGSVVPWRAEN